MCNTLNELKIQWPGFSSRVWQSEGPFVISSSGDQSLPVLPLCEQQDHAHSRSHSCLLTRPNTHTHTYLRQVGEVGSVRSKRQNRWVLSCDLKEDKSLSVAQRKGDCSRWRDRWKKRWAVHEISCICWEYERCDYQHRSGECMMSCTDGRCQGN